VGTIPSVTLNVLLPYWRKRLLPEADCLHCAWFGESAVIMVSLQKLLQEASQYKFNILASRASRSTFNGTVTTLSQVEGFCRQTASSVPPFQWRNSLLLGLRHYEVVIYRTLAHFDVGESTRGNIPQAVQVGYYWDRLHFSEGRTTRDTSRGLKPDTSTSTAVGQMAALTSHSNTLLLSQQVLTRMRRVRST